MVVLSEAQKRRLGPQGRIPVTVEVGGEAFRTSVVHMDERWCFVADAQMRARGLTQGRSHVIEIARDEAPRRLQPPAELAAAMDGTLGARERWEALPWTHQREVADWISEAKRPEMRERRARRAVHEHLGG